MTISIADRITKQHIWLMGDKRTMSYAGLLMIGDVIISEEVKTAATDGKNVIYNPTFVESLTDPELRGLILHEAGHRAFQHLFLWQHLWKKDADKINRATDYVINIGIHDLDPYGSDIQLPDGGLLDFKYRDLDSGQVFDLLDGASNESPLDSHQWSEAKEMSEEEAQAIAKDIDSAMRAGAFMAGKQGGNVDRSFEAMLTPQVDWKEQLRDFVSSVCAGKGDSTWAKPNRRWLGQDIYLPGQIAETIPNIVVAIDTSGSISRDDITKALSELVGICDNVTPERVDLIYWDHRVASHEVYFEETYDRMVASTTPKGGGGTTVECVFQYIEEFNLKPVVCIIITDLCFSFPASGPEYPVLWVAVDNRQTQPPWGTTIRLI